MYAKNVMISAGLALALMTGTATAALVVFSYTGAFQSFTAPTAGIYDITAIGAQGGTGGDGGTGGLGAKVSGDFTLTKGEVLRARPERLLGRNDADSRKVLNLTRMHHVDPDHAAAA